MPHVDWLVALNRVQRNLYAGTVPADEVRRRRAKGKRGQAGPQAAAGVEVIGRWLLYLVARACGADFVFIPTTKE
jgi:hypothetical protein